MLRTNVYLSLVVLFVLILTNLSWGQDSASAQNQGDKTDIVNRQLDEIQQNFSNIQPDTAKVFSQQPALNAEKEFSNQPQVKSRGITGELKAFVNPDLPGETVHKRRSNVRTRIHTVDIGAEVFSYRYQEPSYTTMYGDKTSDVKLRGPMYGYYANYVYRPAAGNLLNNFLMNAYFLQGRFSTSRDLTYAGSGVVKGKHDDATEIRGLIGKDYAIGVDAMVTPYFGFGYRYLFDRGNNQVSSTGATGYDRKSHYYYLPLGGNLAFDLPQNWELDTNAEYDIFISGYQKSFLSDDNQFVSNNPDLVSHQDHGFGLRASVKFLKKGSLLDFYVEPYFRYWNIDQSKGESISINGAAPLIYGEPHNTTTEVGSKFGVQF